MSVSTIIESSDAFKNASKEVKENLNRSADSADKILGSFEKIKDFASQTAATFTGLESAQIFENFKSLAADLVKIQNSTHRMEINLGSMNKSTQNLYKDMNNIQKSLGASRQDANKLVSALAQDRYVGNLKEAAEATYQIGRATGLGATAFEEATVELSKGAQMSETAIKATYATILKTQQTYGLSDKAMKNLSGSIGKLASNWKAFGASDQQIIKMTAETTKFAAAMDKVGISAEESLRKIEKLTNPDNVEDNIKAYAMMGVDIGQAITTGMVDQGQLQAGMMNMANQISGMGALVGNRWSKTLGLGISYTEATKMSRADMSGATQEVGKDNATAELTKLTELTKSGNEKAADILNQTKGWIESLGPVVLFTLGTISSLIGVMLPKILAAIILKNATSAAGGAGRLFAGGTGALFKNILGKIAPLGKVFGSIGKFLAPIASGLSAILPYIAIAIGAIIAIILVVKGIMALIKHFSKKQDKNNESLDANTKSNEQRQKQVARANSNGTVNLSAMNTSSTGTVESSPTRATTTTNTSNTTVYNNGNSKINEMGERYYNQMQRLLDPIIESFNDIKDLLRSGSSAYLKGR